MWLRLVYQTNGWPLEEIEGGEEPVRLWVQEGDEILRQMATFADPPDADPEDLVGVQAARQAVRDAVNGPTLTETELRLARDRLGQVPAAIDAAKVQIGVKLQKRQQALALEYEPLKTDPIEGSNAQKQELIRLRTPIGDALAKEPTKLILDQAAKDLDLLKQGMETVQKAIAEQKARKLQIDESLKNFKDDAGEPNWITGEQKDKIATARALVVNAFAGNEISAEKNDAANEKLGELKNVYEKVQQSIAELKAQTQKKEEQVEQGLKGLETDPKEASAKQKERLAKARKEVQDYLGGELNPTRVGQADTNLGLLKDAMAKVKEEIEAQRKRKAEIEQKLTEYKEDAGEPTLITNAQKLLITQGRAVVTTALSGEEVSAEKNDAAELKLTALKNTYQQILDAIEETKKLAKRKEQLEQNLKPFEKDPKGADAAQKDRLTQARKKVSDFLTGELSGQRLDNAEQQLGLLKQLMLDIQKEIDDSGEDFKKQLKTDGKDDVVLDLLEKLGAADVKKLMTDLGGAKNLGKLTKEFNAAEIGTLCTDLGGATKARNFLEDACGGKAENLKGLRTAFPKWADATKFIADGTGNKPKLLVQLLDPGCGGKPEKLKELHDAFSGNFTNLKGLLEGGGLGDKSVQPGCVGQLLKIGCKGSGADFKLFCDAIAGKQARENLKGLLVDSGFGAKPDCLGQILALGCDTGAGMTQSAQNLVQLADKVKNDTQKLKNLVTAKGGLGDNPEVLGHLIGVGCGKDPAAFKSLLDAFPLMQLDNLTGVVKDGGFAKPGVKPECFGELLATGCGGKPADLAKFCTGFKDGTARKNLTGLLVDGGLGDKPKALSQVLAIGFDGQTNMVNGAKKLKDFAAATKATGGNHAKLKNLLGGADELGDNPEVLGHLAAIGCDKDPAKLNTLLTTFDDNGLTKLNALVKSGGFAKYGPTDGKEVKPECLGQLLKIGCDGAPGDLQTLCTTLNDNDRLALQGIMQTGQLGKSPKVLGHLYKIGCDKTPTDLQAFGTAFQSEADQNKLGDLLEKGGLKGDPDKGESLGKILKDAFKVGATPHPERLKHLHTAFAGDTELAKLKDTMDAYNFQQNPPTTPLKDGEPGKRLKNVLKAMNLETSDNLRELNTVYYKKLKDREGQPGAQPLKVLLLNAATLELNALGEGKQANATPNANVNEEDMKHFRGRHTRSNQTLKGRNLTLGNPISLWPEGTNEVKVQSLLNETMTTIRNINIREQATDGSWVNKPSGTHVNYAFVAQLPGSKLKRVISITNYEVKICFVAYPPNKLDIDQFYPRAGNDIVAFEYDDMVAIKGALKQT
jgi:hypothetical protein